MRDHPVYEVLGSPIASIVATIAADLLQRSVTVQAEDVTKNARTIHLILVGDAHQRVDGLLSRQQTKL